MKELKPLNDILDHLYSEGKNKEIIETLRIAETNNRIVIHEWRNFIDYDIISLLLTAMKEGKKLGRREILEELKGCVGHAIFIRKIKDLTSTDETKQEKKE